jgi:hypothetical protein
MFLTFFAFPVALEAEFGIQGRLDVGDGIGGEGREFREPVPQRSTLFS